MTNDVVLGSALRTNLLSLQRTQDGIDKTQNILSTGLKVNSALDNPQSFFAAQSLNNRASDLTRLLDGIGQSISTIQAADKGTQAITDLLNQADSIAQSARDALAGAIPEAKVTGNVDLGDTDTLVDAGFTADATFSISTVDANGDLVQGSTYTVAAGVTAEQLAATITNDFADNFGGEVSARVNDNGQLEITGNDGQAYRIQGAGVVVNGVAATATAADFAAIGLDIVTAEGGGDTAVTVNAGNTLTSVQLFEATGDIAEAGDEINGLLDAADNTIGVTGNGNITVDITLNDGTAVALTDISTTNLTLQGLVDAINNDAANDDYVTASYDSNTGKLSITAIDASVSTIGIGTDAADQIDFGFGADNLDPRAAAAEQKNFAIGSPGADITSFVENFAEIRSQIDALVDDTDYRGTNLLNGDDLTTFFNENRSSKLETEGTTFTSAGLGLDPASFINAADADETLSQVRSALNDVRSFASSLANSLSIVQTRQSFTEDLVSELEAGAEKLTVADTNAEGAKLLALQTRQQLGVTSLSLAVQSQQSVLRLF